MPFNFGRLDIGDVVQVEPKVFGDARGFFTETFKHSEFRQAGIWFMPVQENHSKSAKGVLRGLHFQIDPFAQAKLVRVVRGTIFDVAVDMRKNSSTFARWVSAELSEHNKHALFIPRGFAHGFVSLEHDTEVVYLADNEYSKDHESGVLWNDAKIGVRWPVNDPILSEKDMKWPTLEESRVFP